MASNKWATRHAEDGKESFKTDKPGIAAGNELESLGHKQL